MVGLEELILNARRLVAEGYYKTDGMAKRAPSLVSAIQRSKGTAVIAEVKFATPSHGPLHCHLDLMHLLDAYVRGGACGISVLSEPHYFSGSIGHLREASKMGPPTLMKDIVVDAEQVVCGSRCGASAVLLIEKVLGIGGAFPSTLELIDSCHEEGLEVVLEVNSLAEYDRAVRTDADIIGINNRDLTTMKVDIHTTARILNSRKKDRPVIAMSGIETRQQILELKKAGADAFLVGRSLVESESPESKLRELRGGGDEDQL